MDRLLLVANRLPVAIRRSKVKFALPTRLSPAGAPEYSFSPGSGGLVTGLQACLEKTPFLWFGWPGLEVPPEEQSTLSGRLRDEHDAVPVFFSDDLAERYYNGFSSV